MRRLAIIVLALTGCVAGPTRTLPPAPAPTATVRLATPTAAIAATASPSPSTPPQRLGLVLATSAPLGLALRTQTDPRPFASLAGAHDATVSPDGHRVAYWHRDDGAPNASDALRALELVTGEEIELLRLQNEAAGGIAWRDDGAALVFSASSVDSVGVGSFERPRYTAIRTVEMGSHQAREVRRFDATTFIPLSWNANAHVIVGKDAAEYLFTLFRLREDGSSAGDTPGQLAPGRTYHFADVTRDATKILLVYVYGTVAVNGYGVRVLGTDPATPIVNRDALQREAWLKRALFRPGTSDVVVLIVDVNGISALEIWPAGSTSVRRVWTGATREVDTTSELIMRVDGKAAYVRINDTVWSWRAIDLETGAAAPIDGLVGCASCQSFFVTDSAIAKLRR